MRQRFSTLLRLGVGAMAVGAVMGGFAKANPSALRRTPPVITADSCRPLLAASAPAATKEANPLEQLAKALGLPAGAILLIGVGGEEGMAW